MKGFWFYLLLCFSVGTVTAQSNFPNEFDTLNAPHKEIQINGQFDLQGTSVKREIFNTLIWGGYIDDGMKQRSFNRHDEINRFGLAANNEIVYYHRNDSLFRKKDLSWGVKAGYSVVGAMSYGKDAFGVVFFGNSSYLDDTAVFSNTRFKMMQFQKVGFGISDRKTGSHLFLNVVNVQQAAEALVRKGELIQNEDASVINLVLSGQMSSTYGSQFSKGVGLSLDGSYRVKVPWLKEKQTVFEVSFSNLGFAYMHGGQVSYQVDSNYTYSGFELSQLTSEASPFNRDDFSVLDSLGIQSDTVYRYVTLPGYIQAGKLVDFQGSTKWQSFFGIRLYPTLNIVPSIYAGFCFKPTKQIMVTGSGSYGGFGNFRCGLGVSYLAKVVRVTLGTDDIVGTISKQGFGQSLILKAAWNLGQ